MSLGPLILESSHDVPLVWLQIAAAGGSAADPAGREGMHRHMVSLSRRGAGERDRATLNAAVDDLGAGLGAVVRRDWVGLYGVCLSRHVDALVSIAIDILRAPRFRRTEHDRLLDDTHAALDELRDDDSDVASRFFTRECCPGHPYARTALGTSETLDSLELPDIRLLHQHTFVRDNIVVGLAGAIEPAHARDLEAQIRDALPALPVASAPDVATVYRPASRRCLLVDKPDRTQAQVLIGHQAPRYGTPEFEALNLVNIIFGGTFTSRLMQEVRAKRGWSYDAGSGLGRARGPLLFRMSMAPNIDVAADAIHLVLDLFQTLARDGIDQEELDFAKSYATGALSFAVATPQQRMNLTVRNRLFGVADDYRATTPERVERVTVESARQAARDWLHPDETLTLVVATADQMRDQLANGGFGPLQVVPYNAY